MKIPPVLARVLCALLLCGAAFPIRAEAAGFGRFGRFHDDGLLTLNLSPTGFETPTGEILHVTWGIGTNRRAAPSPVHATVNYLDPTEKRLALTGGGIGAPTSLRYTLLYPGFSAHFGGQMVLRCTDAAQHHLTGRFQFSPKFSTAQTAVLLLRRDNGSAAVAIFLQGGSAADLHIRSMGRGTIRVDAKRAIGDVRFVTPFGLTENKSGDKSEESLRREVAFWESAELPTRTSSTATLAPGGKSVIITERFRGSIAPIPPLLAFAIAHGYPATVRGRVITTRCRTWQGDFCYVRGHRLRYTLPIPPTDERGYVRRQSASVSVSLHRDKQLLNDLVGHLGGAWATNAVDLGYAGMTNAEMAGTYLSLAKRREVSAAWKLYLPNALSLPPYAPGAKARLWKIATEPLSRQSYLYTYFIDGPGHLHYDIDWGNALPIYGLQKYAQYSGDWKFVRRHFRDVQRVYRYFDLGDDWAWMTVVNADHGYSTGTGDPLAAAYCAAVAGLKMARALHNRTQETHFAVRAARIAVPTVARLWYTKWARRQKFIEPRSIVVGYSEKEGFTTAYDIGRRDPWTATTLLSGDGVLPELFSLYLTFARPALREYEAEYARAYPRWFDGNIRYPFETTYRGNSVYVTFPHIFARAMALNTPTPQLQSWINAAQTNRNNAWIAPNVLAEIMSRPAGKSTPAIVLTEWQPAAYRDGVFTKNGGNIALHFSLSHPADWTLTATLTPNIKPSTVYVNGRRAAFMCQNNRFRLHLRYAPKNLHITIYSVPRKGKSL